MIDILIIDTKDSWQVGQLVDLVRQHCNAEQCVDFLQALYLWPLVRDRPKSDPKRREAWSDLLRWRAFVLNLPISTAA